MNNRDGLERYYSEEEWEEWVDIYKEKWSDGRLQQDLFLLLDNHKDLAIGVYGILEDEAVKWIGKKHLP